jgi:two-component system response regulator AtoC
MPVAKNGHSIILGEDDPEVCSYLETALQCQGYSVEVAQDGEEVLACLQGREGPVSAIVMDFIMPRMDGIEALKEIRRFNRGIPVIMMSGASSPLNVVEAMKNGANDFIAKPINPDDLRKVLKMVIGTKPAVAAGPTDKAATPPANRQVFLSTSARMRELQKLAVSVGWSEAPVLIQGETGVGKEVFARELHACSPRAKKPMLKLNCAALPSELVESELFGYERGAFTGAFQKKPGMFELADGGTILLDEIGDMDFKLQAKLLQVLQDHEFQRLGGKDTVKVDVRVIAATHCDLERAIAENRFREDLYYRLNVISLNLPPLRDHKEDIAGLADFFVKKHTPPGTASVKIPPALQAAFMDYNWPGNIRELENTVRKFIVYRDARLVEHDLHGKLSRKAANGWAPMAAAPAADLPQIEAPVAATNGANGTHWVNGGAHGNATATPEGMTPVLMQVAKAKREAERSAILTTLRNTNWNRRQASVQLQIDYKALLYKMKVLSITKEDDVLTATG